jgi:hypothetical protein
LALISVIFSALLFDFNMSALIFVNAKKLSALISLVRQKWVGHNILGELALIFLGLVTSPEFECRKFFIAKKIEAKLSNGLSHFFKGFERFFSPIRDVYIKVKNQHFQYLIWLVETRREKYKPKFLVIKTKEGNQILNLDKTVNQICNVMAECQLSKFKLQFEIVLTIA